jgi:hypothetical protein
VRRPLPTLASPTLTLSNLQASWSYFSTWLSLLWRLLSCLGRIRANKLVSVHWFVLPWLSFSLICSVDVRLLNHYSAISFWWVAPRPDDAILVCAISQNRYPVWAAIIELHLWFWLYQPRKHQLSPISSVSWASVHWRLLIYSPFSLLWSMWMTIFSNNKF